MKKIIIAVIALSVITLSMSFVSSGHPKKKAVKHQSVSLNKTNKTVTSKAPTCSCPQAYVKGTSSDGTTLTIALATCSGCQSFSVGGYYSSGTHFSYCGTTNTIVMPISEPHGTFQVTANCDNTVCTSATCSGSPSLSQTF